MMKETLKNKPEDTRQQILETAKSIILGKGFAAVGLNEILTAASVPKGSFYHYFKSKEQFGNALLEDYFDDYMINLEELLQYNDTPALDRLMSFFQYWFDSQLSETTEDKCLVVKLSAEVTDLSEAMRNTLNAGTRKVIERLAVTIQEAIDHKELTCDEGASQFAQELYYMWIGATLLTKVSHTADALECVMHATLRKFCK